LEAKALDDDVQATDLIAEYDAEIAALERMLAVKEGLNKSQPAEDSRVFSMARSAKMGLIQTFLKR
jgi:hypothetical protein